MPNGFDINICKSPVNMLGFMRPFRTSLALRAVPQRQYFSTANGFRPRQKTRHEVKGIRQATTEAGEEKSGHIDAGPNEGILFFDSRLRLRSTLFGRDAKR